MPAAALLYPASSPQPSPCAAAVAAAACTHISGCMHTHFRLHTHSLQAGPRAAAIAAAAQARAHRHDPGCGWRGPRGPAGHTRTRGQPKLHVVPVCERPRVAHLRAAGTGPCMCARVGRFHTRVPAGVVRVRELCARPCSAPLFGTRQPCHVQFQIIIPPTCSPSNFGGRLSGLGCTSELVMTSPRPISLMSRLAVDSLNLVNLLHVRVSMLTRSLYQVAGARHALRCQFLEALLPLHLSPYKRSIPGAAGLPG